MTIMRVPYKSAIGAYLVKSVLDSALPSGPGVALGQEIDYSKISPAMQSIVREVVEHGKSFTRTAYYDSEKKYNHDFKLVVDLPNESIGKRKIMNEKAELIVCTSTKDNPFTHNYVVLSIRLPFKRRSNPGWYHDELVRNKDGSFRIISPRKSYRAFTTDILFIEEKPFFIQTGVGLVGDVPIDSSCIDGNPEIAQISGREMFLDEVSGVYIEKDLYPWPDFARIWCDLRNAKIYWEKDTTGDIWKRGYYSELPDIYPERPVPDISGCKKFKSDMVEETFFGTINARKEYSDALVKIREGIDSMHRKDFNSRKRPR